MRSKSLTQGYWEDFCKSIFGMATDTQNANIELGGESLKVSNTFFTNGFEDGWIWAGIQEAPKGA